MNTFLRKSVISWRRFFIELVPYSPRLIVLIDFLRIATYTGRYCVSWVNHIHILFVNNFPVYNALPVWYYIRMRRRKTGSLVCPTVLILRLMAVHEIGPRIFFVATYVLRVRTIGVFDTNPRVTIVYTICRMFAQTVFGSHLQLMHL